MWAGRDDLMDNACGFDEKPAHTVTLNTYQMGKYEVTFAEWDACGLYDMIENVEELLGEWH